MLRILPSCCFLITLIAVGSPRGIAAPLDAAKFAVTAREEAGADFILQGEYLGTVTTAHGYEYAGLQVVALGDGKFDAVYLKGGLPAAGWNRRDKLKLHGVTEAGRLKLEAAGSKSNSAAGSIDSVTNVQVDGQFAIMTDRQGRELGRLEKIHRISPTLGAAPPAGAKVLFDGSRADQFSGGSMTADGLLNAGATTKVPVGDFRLHLEFRTPYMPYAREQGRGNSGVYIQQRYEVQILDSFGLAGAINECGSLYKQRPPDVNTCLPPLAWQTYDIYFTAARWDAGRHKTASARITVLLNGERVHDNVQVTDKTGSGKEEGPEVLPINLQNHGNPVHFRNMWLVAGTAAAEGATYPAQSRPGTCRRPAAWR